MLTHQVPPEVPAGEPAYTYVTDGIRSAGLLDEIVVNLVPVLLGRGVRLLDRLEPPVPRLACTGVVDAPGVTHLTYRVTYR